MYGEFSMNSTLTVETSIIQMSYDFNGKCHRKNKTKQKAMPTNCSAQEMGERKKGRQNNGLGTVLH